MRTIRSREQQKAMFANMNDGKYIPISRFAEDSKKSDIVAEQPILKTESVVVKTDEVPPIEYKFNDESKVNEKIPEEVLTESFTGKIPVSVESGEKLVTPEEVKKLGDLKYRADEFQKKLEYDKTNLSGVTKPEVEVLSKEEAEKLFNKQENITVGSVYDNDEFKGHISTGSEPVIYKTPYKFIPRSKWDRERINAELGRISDQARIGFERGIGKGFEQMGREAAVGAEHTAVKIIKAPVNIAKGVVMAPYNVAKYGKEQAGRAVGLAGKAGKRVAAGGMMVLAPAAAAFGTTAGVGVTEALRETGDLITAPKREFYIPPGYQRVWTGEGNNYVMQYIGSPQVQPTFMTPSMGVAMPPGVTATREDIAEALSGSKNVPIFRGIEDEEKASFLRLGTADAGRAFERRRMKPEDISPQMNVARMPMGQAAQEFMRRSKGGERMAQGMKSSLTEVPRESRLGMKSQKQMEIEAIMNMPIMDAADAFEKKAKIVISTRQIPVQVPSYVAREVRSPITVPISVRVPLSS